jgi:tetratricopeptide (TPR) repeat protein
MNWHVYWISAATCLATWAAIGPRACAQIEASTARAMQFRGRFDEAIERYSTAAGHDPAAAIGLARCKLATGKRAEAQLELTAAAERFPKSAPIQAELSLLSLARGDHVAAAKQAAAALAIDKDCLAARWAQAELLRLEGKLNEAQNAYGWFIGYYNRSPRIENPDDLVFIGCGVAEHARWTRNSSQFRRLVNEVYPTALTREPSFWPAHLELARLFLEKFNQADAVAEIARGLAINPNAAELHAARAELALARFELAPAKRSLDRALEINPELLWAHQLRADWLLADLRLTDAIAVLQKALELNPRDERTLGRLLAAYIAADPPGPLSPRSAQLIDEATERNPHCGELFLAAADSFDRMRRFPLAAEHLRIAQQRMPQLISLGGRLGLVLMRLGEEAEAARLLAESFAVDPFNVRVKNMLEVLDVLKGYATLETEHFVIRFDRGQDELLARYAGRYLEDDVFPDLTRRLGYFPKEKTLIEIFSRTERTSGHSWFSARMVGLPFIGTVGACAGKMVALASPTKVPEKYDWALVLRHELVHVLNLQQTQFAVPHWLTEGLAVHLEGQPRPKKWTEMLVSRARNGELFNLDTLTLGFIRPQSSDDWTLAYCQAELYVEYLLATYGDDAINRLLAAYADRCATAQALQRCYRVEQTEFEAGYRRFVEKIVESAYDTLPRAKMPLADLQRRAEANPDNAAAAAELALAWLDRDDKPEARRWALAAKRSVEKQPLAAYVLARLQLEIGDHEQAQALLEAALDNHAPHEELLALLAALKLKLGDTAAAEALYRLGDQHFPASDRWVKGLARIYLQLVDSAKLTPVLRRWSELEPGNLSILKKLAQLALAEKDFATALKSATQALHLDVQDVEVHALLAAALTGENKVLAAIDEYEVAIRLDSRQIDCYAALARLQIRVGRKDDARLVIGRLRDLDPRHSQLTELEKSLLP